MRRTKTFFKSVAAATPLLVSMASPASACLLTGASDTAAERSPEIRKGPIGTGPMAPVSGLQNADARNGDAKDLCQGMMCDPSGRFSDD